MILRAAAVVAARHGLDDTARELLAAAPPAGELTVIGELFPDEVRRLEVRRVPRRRHPTCERALDAPAPRSDAPMHLHPSIRKRSNCGARATAGR